SESPRAAAPTTIPGASVPYSGAKVRARLNAMASSASGGHGMSSDGLLTGRQPMASPLASQRAHMLLSAAMPVCMSTALTGCRASCTWIRRSARATISCTLAMRTSKREGPTCAGPWGLLLLGIGLGVLRRGLLVGVALGLGQLRRGVLGVELILGVPGLAVGLREVGLGPAVGLGRVDVLGGEQARRAAVLAVLDQVQRVLLLGAHGQLLSWRPG